MKSFHGKWKKLLWVLTAVWFVVPVLGLGQTDPPMERIPLKKARSIALRKCPGKVKNYEFKPYKNKWVYFFKILDKKQAANYLYIDAVTGKIVTRFSDPAPKPKPTEIQLIPAQATPAPKGKK